MKTQDGFSIGQWKELALTSDASDASKTSPMVAAATTANQAATLVKQNAKRAKFTSSAAHGLLDGTYVNIDGATDTGFNGYVKVNVTGTTTFEYTLVGTPAVDTDLGGAFWATLKVRAFDLAAAAGNAGTVTFGPTSAGTSRGPLAAGQGYGIDSPRGASASGFAPCFDLAQWYFKGSQTSQQISILYLV